MAQSTKKTTSQTKRKSSATANQLAVRRQLWGCGYILVSFLLFLALLNVDGFVLVFLKDFFKGSIGIGFYLLPFCILFSGVMLIRHKKGKIRRTIALTMCLPFILGIIGHSVIAGKSIKLTAFKELYETGKILKSGGVISGFLGAMLATAFSSIGAGVISILAFLVTSVLAFKIDVLGIISKIKNSFPEEDEEEEEIIPFKKPNPPAISAKSKPKIDIILDGEDRPAPKRGEKIDIAPPNVKTPAQVLSLQSEKTSGIEVAPPTEEFFEEEEKQTDGLMKAAEESRIISSVKHGLDSILPWHKPEKEESNVLPDRFDAVKPDSTGPIQIDQPLAERMSIAPTVQTEPSPPVLQEKEEIPEDVKELMLKHSLEELNEYLFPPVSLLKKSIPPEGDPQAETKILADRLVDTLLSFGVDTNVVGVTRGPTVTRYELVLQRGTKFSRVSNLSEDIALSLGAPSVRISTIPDKLAIGIEVPNTKQEMVTIRDIIDSNEFRSHKSKVCFPVGKDIANQKIVGDIAKMPHMLIAGTTGSGKSVCINSILISLLYKASPDDVRLIMIDPKMIELGVYNGIPHLLIPVVTDPKKASGALNWAVGEMMRRYKLLSEMGVRDLASYNEEVKSRGEGEKLPQIVIVIDELADLMFVAAREVEEAIARIAQMARAAGMHLIIATQRPSADIITGIMKANIPSRVAFAVASQIESRIIMDTAGAEKLIGKGDMLYAPLGISKPMRVQGCFISTGEVESVVEFIKKTSVCDYKNDIIEHIEHAAENTGKGSTSISGGDDSDPLMNDAIQIIVETGQASTSMLQRRLKLGYSRASRLIDQMEERGIVGPFEGSKPRQVLISKSDWQEMVLRQHD